MTRRKKIFAPICDPPGSGECYPGEPVRGGSRFTAIDIFAGAGGASVGMENAGARVIWAINHWDRAIAAHYLNHPHVTHCCEDAFMFPWERAPVARLIWASPACTAHSSAATHGLKRGRRGTAPLHDRLRASALSVPVALSKMAHNARGLGEPAPIVIVENVQEFITEWESYAGWKVMIENIRPGYSISEYVLDAQDFGVPQSRKRAFVIATPSRTPFDLKLPNRTKATPFRTCISRDKDLEWTPVRQWKARDAKYGTSVYDKYLLKKSKFKTNHDLSALPMPEVWAWHNSTDTLPTHPDLPIRTITHKSGGQWYMVRSTPSGDEMRKFTVDEFRKAMGFPSSYMLPDSVEQAAELLGNAVCPPVAEWIASEVMRRA
jgi:DNA (cytosine-5)-methyltransferase 1